MKDFFAFVAFWVFFFILLLWLPFTLTIILHVIYSIITITVVKQFDTAWIKGDFSYMRSFRWVCFPSYAGDTQDLLLSMAVIGNGINPSH